MDLDLTDEERRLLAADDRATARVGVWLIAIFGPMAAALLIVLGQTVQWLKTGSWSPVHVGDMLAWIGVEAPVLTWAGIQRILQWVLECPLAGLLFFTGLAMIFLFTRGDNRESEALRTARMKKARRKAGWDG